MAVLTSVLVPPAPNPVDLLFHVAGKFASHQEAAPNVGVVLHLTGDAPALADLRARLAERLHRLPCLTHVLTDGTADDTPPRWTPTAPDLDTHVGRLTVSGRLDDTVRELLHRPLPTDAPAWHLTLLTGHAPRRYALALITTHAVQDAANLVTVVETLLAPEDTATEDTSDRQLTPPTPRQLLDTTAHIWRSTRPHHLWTDPEHPLSGRRHVVWQKVPTRLLKDTAQAYGATSNDVHLAALAHAVRRWAAEHRPAADRDPLPLMLPVNLRTPEETALPGNRFFLARLDLPGGPMTPARRLTRTRAATAPLRDPDHRRTLYRMIRQEPDQYAQLIAHTTAPGSLTVVGSIFRVPGRLSLDGDPVDRVVPIICCPDGFPLTVGLFLYGDTSTASFQIDRSLPGAEEIPDRWRAAIDDMAACAPGADR
ncbi:wax ester/triacylglycerol synthase domain-containing protein [Streptomyces sp. NPDC047072]|uniref:wax ester/triacylglycerol synthase domain-containing protein n=1 Tax=Streptomyces sp. NPDC047072 TaxID=3154809 RepID=UPI0033E1BD5F